MTHDFYEILQVHPNADQEAIQAAYERLSVRYDPARLEGMAEELLETAKQRRAALDQAYAILSDPQQRAAYDSSQGPATSSDDAADQPDQPDQQIAVTKTAAPLLDYRPLPPAVGQERPRHFDASPQQQRPAPAGSRRTALIVGLVTILAIVGLSLGMSGFFTQPSVGTAPLSSPTATMPAPTPSADASASGYDRFEASISEARRATEQSPNDVAAWVLYGNALFDSVQIVFENEPNGTLYRERLPRWLEASKAYERALQLQGKQPSPLLLSDRGASLCYYGKGTGDQSYVTQGLADTRTAATAAPNESLVLFNYGNCLISANPPQFVEAAQQWQRILEVTPADSPIAARARELLTEHAAQP